MLLTASVFLLVSLADECRYEDEGRARKVVRAQQLWFAILEAQIETGNPYMLYKDACNRKSNQQNLGTIKCSNLCTEIVEFTSPDETAVCNLASIALPRFVRERNDQGAVQQVGPDSFSLICKTWETAMCFDLM